MYFDFTWTQQLRKAGKPRFYGPAAADGERVAIYRTAVLIKKLRQMIRLFTEGNPELFLWFVALSAADYLLGAVSGYFIEKPPESRRN